MQQQILIYFDILSYPPNFKQIEYFLFILRNLRKHQKSHQRLLALDSSQKNKKKWPINLLPSRTANQAKRKFANDTATSALLLRNTVTCNSLCGIPFLPKSHKRKRPQHAPEQTYRRISLRRSMLRSSLCFYLVTNATRLHSVTSDDT